MKKRKRAKAEPGRDQSSPPEEAAAASSAKAPVATKEDAAPAQEAAGADGAPVAEAAPSEEAPAGEAAPTAEAPTHEAGPASDDANAAWSDEEHPQPPGASASSADVPAPAGADAAPAVDDDSGWEDAPTRELDLGNMEFAATWSDAHDTLPNVDLEGEGAEGALGFPTIGCGCSVRNM